MNKDKVELTWKEKSDRLDTQIDFFMMLNMEDFSMYLILERMKEYVNDRENK